MSIDVLNETDFALDELELVACSRYVLAQMRVHPQADLCLRLVDEAAMETLHVQWMDLPGPTDVMSSPDGRAAAGPRGHRAAGGRARRHRALPERRREAGPRGRPRDRGGAAAPHDARHPAPARATTTRRPTRRREMFELQRQLLLTFLATRGRPTA